MREAITAANNNPGFDLIRFNIPGTGVRTLNVGSNGDGDLPEITEPAYVDGCSQPGSSMNTRKVGTNAKPMIELDGTDAGGGSEGLDVVASGTVIRGLVRNNFAEAGIRVRGTPTTVTEDVRIEGNFIGIDPPGTKSQANIQEGIYIVKATNTAAPETRNLISGAQNDGVEIFEASGNKVLGNLIGTNKGGKGALGASFDGVSIVGSNNVVGGNSAAATNTIACNNGSGVHISFDQSKDNRVLRNSIFSNGDMGIDLGPGDLEGREQDSKDGDLGPNNLQNFPALTSAKTSDAKTTIKASSTVFPTAPSTSGSSPTPQILMKARSS